jgi:hypothetical protein
MQLPLEALVFKPNMPAGMDWAVIGLWTCRFRKTAELCDPPITVTRIDGTPHYRILDGRHRVVASLIAGRTHITAVEEPCPAG